MVYWVMSSTHNRCASDEWRENKTKIFIKAKGKSQTAVIIIIIVAKFATPTTKFKEQRETPTYCRSKITIILIIIIWNWFHVFAPRVQIDVFYKYWNCLMWSLECLSIVHNMENRWNRNKSENEKERRKKMVKIGIAAFFFHYTFAKTKEKKNLWTTWSHWISSFQNGNYFSIINLVGKFSISYISIENGDSTLQKKTLIIIMILFEIFLCVF